MVIAAAVRISRRRGQRNDCGCDDCPCNETGEDALIESGAIRIPRLSRRSWIITGDLRRRVRNIRERREYGVKRGIARCGSSGLVLRDLC